MGVCAGFILAKDTGNSLLNLQAAEPQKKGQFPATRKENMNKRKRIAGTALVCILGGLVCAQGSPAVTTAASAASVTAAAVTDTVFAKSNLPVTRVVLFSSGVGFFQHAGQVENNSLVELPFRLEDINDALKSLVINDSGRPPQVSYPSEETLERSLRSLKIDLSGAPSVADILARLRGAELVAQASQRITGRIMGVEHRIDTETGASRAYVSLFTREGIRVLALDEVTSFSFTDERLNGELNRALDILYAATDNQTRVLSVKLSGSGRRQVSLGYVVPVPVWKASYRIDITEPAKTFLQGWAIVDNAGDIDWKNVQLALVTGRPVSFIQNLLEPLYVRRPVIPLSIAGFAQARTYSSGFAGAPPAPQAAPALAGSMALSRSKSAMEDMDSMMYEAESAPREALAASQYDTTTARTAGDQFEFTVRAPVTLDRRQSAMIPLTETRIKAEKVSVYSGSGQHPMLCAWLENTSGMKLPAGPVTVFDDNSYAGDALIEFFPENERRLIAYGEDLQVRAMASSSSASETASVTVVRGVMTISRRVTATRTYTFKNSSGKNRTIVVEHPVSAGQDLIEPVQYEEKTENMYRFKVPVAAGGEVSLPVRERRIVRETVVLVRQRPESILAWSTNGEIPARIRTALERAVALKRQADDAAQQVTDLQNRRTELAGEQDRVRRNIEAAGRESVQGRDFMKQLTTLEAEIGSVSGQLETARTAARNALAVYEQYLGGLNLE